MSGGGGGGGQPVPGKTKQKQVEKTKSETQGEQYGETSGTTTSSVTPTLDAEIAAGIKDQFGNYIGSVDQFGQRIEDWQAAGFSPDQLAGFESWRGAAGPGGAQQTALDQLAATARGDYLYGGEGFNAAVDAAYRRGMPQVLSRFGGAGRDDGGLAKVALAQAFADPFAAQYGQERGFQQEAQRLLPGMSLLPGQTLQDIGKQYQELEQYGRNFPLSLYPQLAQLQQGTLNFAQPFLGQTTTGSTSGTTYGTSQQMVDAINRMNTTSRETPAYFPGSQTAGLLGGIATGAGVGGQIGGPWGAAAGAGVGGLLSAIG
jgi:hypothetical protein